MAGKGIKGNEVLRLIFHLIIAPKFRENFLCHIRVRQFVKGQITKILKGLGNFLSIMVENLKAIRIKRLK